MKKAFEWLAKHPRAAGTLFGAAMGLATWGLCRVGAYPAEMLARRLSEDGELSEAYVGLIRGGQAKLAQAFWIAAALAGWLDAGRLAKWFRGLPFWRVAAAAGLAAAIGAGAAVEEGASEMGGGALPGVELPTALVAVRSDKLSAAEIAKRLRCREVPVVARVQGDAVVLDMRTLLAGEDAIVVEAAKEALHG